METGPISAVRSWTNHLKPCQSNNRDKHVIVRQRQRTVWRSAPLQKHNFWTTCTSRVKPLINHWIPRACRPLAWIRFEPQQGIAGLAWCESSGHLTKGDMQWFQMSCVRMHCITGTDTIMTRTGNHDNQWKLTQSSKTNCTILWLARTYLPWTCISRILWINCHTNQKTTNVIVINDWMILRI